jgi:hypothetical protein
MKRLLLSVAGLIAFSAYAMAQNASPAQQSPRGKPGLNLMRHKQVDPRVEQYRRAVDREYDAALKKIPEQKQKTNNDPWADIRSGKK